MPLSTSASYIHHSVDPSHTFCTNPEPMPMPDQCGGDQDPPAPILGTCFQCAFFGQVELSQGEPNPSQADHTKVLECLFSLFNNYSPTRDWVVTSLNPSEAGTCEYEYDARTMTPWRTRLTVIVPSPLLSRL